MVAICNSIFQLGTNFKNMSFQILRNILSAYVFMDEGANSQFIVYSTLDNEKDQGICLRKLYDKSNKNIIFEDVVIGEHTYIVHTKEQATYDYGFYVQSANGYSYHFQYILPYDTVQNEIPAEAISILSTLSMNSL